MFLRAILLLFIACRFSFLQVESCTGVQKEKKPKTKAEQENEAVSHQLVNIVLQSRLGKDVDFKSYDNKHYIRENGGPVDQGDELACDFESPCCWTNPTPEDSKERLDWNVVDENIDPGTFDHTFKTAERPDGHFLLATSAVLKSKLRAEFVSCDILCSEKEISVTFRHWTTPKVKLEVCAENAFAIGKKQDPHRICKDVPARSSPGPTTVSLPAGDYFVIKFVASNFADKGGGLAILDDIAVITSPCSNAPQPKNTKPAVEVAEVKTATPLWPRVRGSPATHGSLWPRAKFSNAQIKSSVSTTETGRATGSLWPRAKTSNALIRSSVITGKNESACEKLTCDFEGTTCGYIDANGRISDRAVHYLHGKIGNQSLGIQGPAKGKAYIGSILRPGDSIALEATELDIAQDSFLRFQVLRSNTNLKLCLNRVSNCPFSTDQGTVFTAGAWKAARVKIPANTHTVYFIGENKGERMGVVGLDDVALVSSGNSDSSC